MRANQTCLIATVMAACLISGCKKHDDPLAPQPPANEDELITTLNLHLHSANGVEHFHFAFTDPDGDGGSAPLIETDTLSLDSVYTVEIQVLNESVSPAEDITAEIQAEGDAHQFFFQTTSPSITVAYADADANGMPIGLHSTWTLGAASNGTMVVTLRHGPVKSAPGVSEGDISNAGGDTDIEVIFPLVIE